MTAESLPLLRAEHVSVNIGDVPAFDPISVTVLGDRALLLGAPRGLFDAAAGLAEIATGDLIIGGLQVRRALRARAAAAVVFDGPVPASWTTREYVVWSARLAGLSERAAETRAEEAINRTLLDSHAATSMMSLTVAGRRAANVAAALATGAPVLLLDDPSRDLPDEIARALTKVLAAAMADRRWLLFAGEISLSSPLALESDNAVILHRGAVQRAGAPAAIAIDWRPYTVVVDGDVRAVAGELAARGRAILWQSGAEIALLLDDSFRARDLLALALEKGATVLELSPLGACLRA